MSKKDNLPEKCSNLVNKIFDIEIAKSKETASFKDISHDEACEAFRYWLEQMRIVFPEPVNIAITQSLRDDGVDVLLEFLKSKVKFGFQIKSYGDINELDFTKNTLAQIARSKKHDIHKFYLALCGDLTDISQREKVRGITAEVSVMGDYCTVLSPEKTLKIIKTYQEKAHPASQIYGGMGQVMAMISALQTKLSEDPFYNPKVSVTYKLKKEFREEERPIKFNLTVKHPKDNANKTLWDIIKEMQVAGKPVTISGENIEKFEAFKDGKRIMPKGTKPQFLTLTPERQKLPPLIFEIVDPTDNSTINFDDVIFEKDAVEGTTLHASTHKNNLPYEFRMSIDIGINSEAKSGMEVKVGNFGFSLNDNADVEQRLKFERAMIAINAGQEVVFKKPDGEPLMGGKVKVNSEIKPVDEGWLNLLKDLALIQQKTATCIYLHKSLEDEDLYTAKHISQLLRNGKTEISSMTFSISFTKDGAKVFLNEVKEKKMLPNIEIKINPLKANLFGKELLLGQGVYLIPEVVAVDDVQTIESAVEQLKDNETITIKVKNSPNCTVTLVLYPKGESSNTK